MRMEIAGDVAIEYHVLWSSVPRQFINLQPLTRNSELETLNLY